MTNNYLILLDGEYYTSERIFSHGMWACYHCGEINSIDADHCKNCREDKFFVIADKRFIQNKIYER